MKDKWVYKLYWLPHVRSICGSFVGLLQDYRPEELGHIVDEFKDKEKVYVLATTSETGPATQTLINYLREYYGLFKAVDIEIPKKTRALELVQESNNGEKSSQIF